MYQKNYQDTIHKQNEEAKIKEIKRFEDNLNQEAANRGLLKDTDDAVQKYEDRLAKYARR